MSKNKRMETEIREFINTQKLRVEVLRKNIDVYRDNDKVDYHTLVGELRTRNDIIMKLEEMLND